MPLLCNHNKLVQLIQRLWFVLALFAASEISWAQKVVLYLQNGDRISGEIISDTGSELILSTAFAGRLTVAKSQISRREMPVAPTTTSAPAPAPPARPASGHTNAPAAKPAPAPASGASPTSAAPGSASSAAKPPESNLKTDFRKFLSAWQGELELGLNLGYSTTDRQTYSGRFKATHAHSTKNQRMLRNTLDHIFSYGRTDGALVDNRMDGSWKLEYEVGKRFLVYNAAGAGYDEIRKIDLQYDVGPGVGYKLITRTNYVLKAEFGGNYQEQFLSDKTRKTRYSLRLAEDSWWQVSQRLRIDEKVEFFPEVTDPSDFRIRLEGNVSYRLLDNLILKLTLIDLYETNPARNVSNNDLQIRSSIGIKF